jgi:methylmalonyl-CoA/ethylmalonyl-CoA epimerase
MKLHHVGVAVKSLDAAIKHYEALGLKLAHRETVSSQKVEVAFMGERPWVELCAATAPDSKIAKFIEARGEGQHHVAFGVKSVAQVLETEKKAGRSPIDLVPRAGAWGHTIAFLHPKDHGGTLIELVEEAH